MSFNREHRREVACKIVQGATADRESDLAAAMRKVTSVLQKPSRRTSTDTELAYVNLTGSVDPGCISPYSDNKRNIIYVYDDPQGLQLKGAEVPTKSPKHWRMASP